MSIFIVNRTDDWHSNASFDLLGVATTKKKAIKLVKQQAKKEGFKLSADNKAGLKGNGQTYNSKFDGEFDIREINLNELQ